MVFYKVLAGGEYISDEVYADDKEAAYEQIGDDAEEYILYTPDEYDHWFGIPIPNMTIS
mgnify:CR=1 FL=1